MYRIKSDDYKNCTDSLYAAVHHEKSDTGEGENDVSDWKGDTGDRKSDPGAVWC